MSGNIMIGLMIPFLGTSLGAACVFLMKNKMSRSIERYCHTEFSRRSDYFHAACSGGEE